MSEAITVLAVDDQPANLRLLDALLSPRGYRVLAAGSGESALATLRTSAVDLVLLDIMMPGMDGYEVCRRIRNDPTTAFLPVVVITASGGQQKVRAIEAGADDFVTKPFNRDELLARIASLARLKKYHDTIERQAAELAKWNSELSERVEAQVTELQRANRLRRFLSPQLAELVIDSGDESFLESHRREIVVVFCDLRNFTGFAESSEPEEVTGVLNEYHAALGELIFRVRRHSRAVHRRRSDGVLQRSDALCRRSGAGGGDGGCHARAGRLGWPMAGGAAVMTLGLASVSPRASPPSVGSASPADRTTPRSAASPTWRHGCVAQQSEIRSW